MISVSLPFSKRKIRVHRTAKSMLCVTKIEVSPWLACKSFNQFKNPARRRAIQVSGRFVGQQQTRMANQRPGQRHALLLAA